MMQKSIHGLQALAILVTFALTGCGGGGGGSTTPVTPTVGENSVVYAVRNVAPASACPNGGISVDGGIDTNGNGVLDLAEVTSTQYVCNGANGSTGSAGSTGPAGPAGAGITWEVVAGTSVQGVSNKGYLANNSSQVTITLPASPAVGDTVQVTGIGAGGWKIAQNAGQSVIARDLGAWTPHGPAKNWTSVASSADGTKLVATENTGNTGHIFTSVDSGQTWTSANNSVAANWQSVASSADGAKLVAVVGGGGFIFRSADSGATWTQSVTPAAAQQWTSVASSSDGVKLVATASPGQIFTSIDSSANWTPRATVQNWQSVASSSDGFKLVAAVSVGQIFTSTDSGLTWSSANNSTSTTWQSVASSADGTKLVAVETNGRIFTSADSGLTWTPRNVFGGWQSVASSSDGAKLIAVVSNTTTGLGNIFLSTDSGQSWKQQEQWENWAAAASSADGNALVVMEGIGGLIYSFRGATTAGTAGSISGSQYDAIELQYIGGNTFTVLSHSGSLVVQ